MWVLRPLLLFLLLPLALGCGFRVWWPDLTPPLMRWSVRVAILCLLFNLNFTLVAYWGLFEQEWGTEESSRPWPVRSSASACATSPTSASVVLKDVEPGTRQAIIIYIPNVLRTTMMVL